MSKLVKDTVKMPHLNVLVQASFITAPKTHRNVPARNARLDISFCVARKPSASHPLGHVTMSRASCDAGCVLTACCNALMKDHLIAMSHWLSPDRSP